MSRPLNEIADAMSLSTVGPPSDVKPHFRLRRSLERHRGILQSGRPEGTVGGRRRESITRALSRSLGKQRHRMRSQSVRRRVELLQPEVG